MILVVIQNIITPERFWVKAPKQETKMLDCGDTLREDGTLQSEGEFAEGKKTGLWTTYFPSGKISSKGNYISDDPAGKWEYFFEDGTV